jgi:elongation of very long chain fatty acids protein 4
MTDAYIAKMTEVGDAILKMADPTGEYSGYTEGWLFTSFPFAITVAIAYVSFVVIGSTVMSGCEAKDPYPLKFVYNVMQIMLCAYMTIEAGLLAYRNSYSVLPCNTYNTENPPLANLLWLFYVSKILDFWDTIFIVLGKKWKQLSFLHVYHHTTIFLFYWVNVNVYYDGDVFLTILLNGFIHTVMYTYYFICMHTKDPKTGKSLNIWWKSSLTMMQMIQFVCMMTQAATLVFTGCPQGPKGVIIVYFFYILSLLFLFAQFYVQSYTKKPKKKTV